MSRIDLSGFGQIPQTQSAPTEAIDPFACSEEEAETPIESTPAWILSAGYEQQVKPIEPCFMELDSFRGTSSHIKVMMNGGNLASALKKPVQPVQSIQYPPELVSLVVKLTNRMKTTTATNSASEEIKKETRILAQECHQVCKNLGFTWSQNLIQEVLNQFKNAKQTAADRASQPQTINTQASNPFASSSEPAPSKEKDPSQNPMMGTFVRRNLPVAEPNAPQKPQIVDPLSAILETMQPNPVIPNSQVGQPSIYPFSNPIAQQLNTPGSFPPPQNYLQNMQQIQAQLRQISANPHLMAYCMQQQMLAMQSANPQFAQLGAPQGNSITNQMFAGTIHQIPQKPQLSVLPQAYQQQVPPQLQAAPQPPNPLLQHHSQPQTHQHVNTSAPHTNSSSNTFTSMQPQQQQQPQSPTAPPISTNTPTPAAHTVVSSEDIDSSPDEALKEKHYRHYTEMKRSGKSKREIKKSIQDKERMKMLNRNLAGGPLRKESSQKTIGIKTSKMEAEESLMAEIKPPENLLQQPQPIVAEEAEQPPLPHPALSPEEQAARAAEETHKMWMKQHLHPVPIWKRDSSKFVKERFREHMREIERESVAKRRARIETREITLLSTKVRYSHQVEFRDADTKEMREISIHLPFVPDNQQTKMLDELIHAMNKQTQIALETVAGCGRSILVMAASLAWLKAKQERRRHSDSKIFFVVENESEIKFAIKEMESLPYSPKYTILADRDRQCTNKSLRFFQGNYKEIACVNLNKGILSNPALKSHSTAESKTPCACPHLESLHSAGSLPQDRASYLPDLESLWEDQEDERHTTRYTPCAYYHSRAALSAAHIVFIPLSLVGTALGLSGNSMAPPSPSTTYGFLSAKGEKTPQFQVWNPFQQPSSFLSFPPAPQSSSLLTSATIPPSIFSASLFLLLPSTPNTITAPSATTHQPAGQQPGQKKNLRFEVSPPPANQGTSFKPQFQLLPQAAIPARRCYPWNLTPNATCTSLSNLVLPLHLLQRLGHTPIERVAHNLLIILRTKPQEMAAPQLFDILTMAVAGGIRLRHTDTGLPECAEDEQNGFEYNLEASQNGGEAFDHLAPVSTESLFGNIGAMDKLIRLINSAEEMLLDKFNQNDIHTMSEHMESLVTISQWVRWLDKVKDLYYEHTNVSAVEQDMQHFRLIIEQRPDLQMKESIALVLECQTPRIFFKNIRRTNPISIVISSPSMTPFDDIASEINLPGMMKLKSGVPDSLKNTENIHVAILNTISKEGPNNTRIKGSELISIISCANPSKDRPVLVLFPTAEQLHDWVSPNIANLTKLQVDIKGCIYIEGTWDLPNPSLDDGKKISLEQVAEALSKLDKLTKLANGETKPQENKQAPQLMPFVNSSVSLNGQGCSVIFAVLGGLVCQHRRRSYNSAVPGVRLIIMAGRIQQEDFSNSSPCLIRKQQYIERQNLLKTPKLTPYTDWVRLSASKTLNETMGLLNRKREMAALVLIGQEYDEDLKNTRAFRPWYRSAYNIYNDTEVLLGPLREFFEGKKIPTSRTTKLKPMDMLEKDVEEKSVRYKPTSRLVKHGEKSESSIFQPSNIRPKRSSLFKEEKSVQAPFYQKYNQGGEVSERSIKKANINPRKFGVFNDKEDNSDSDGPFSRLKSNTNEMYEPSKKNSSRLGKKKGSQTMNGTPEKSNFTSSEAFGGTGSDLFTALQQDMKNLSLSSSSEHPEASKPMIPVPHEQNKQDKGAKSDFEIIQEKFRLTTSSVGSQKGARKEKSETREDTLEIIDENEAGRTQRLTEYLGKRRLTWDYSPSETSTKGLPQTSPKLAKESRPNIITVQEVRDPLGIGLPESEDSVSALVPLMMKSARQESGRQHKHGGDAPLRPRAMFDDSNDSGEASYLKSTKSDSKRYQNSTTSQTGPRDSRRDPLGDNRSHRLTSRNKRPRVEQMEPQEYKSPLTAVSGGGYKGFSKEYHR